MNVKPRTTPGVIAGTASSLVSLALLMGCVTEVQHPHKGRGVTMDGRKNPRPPASASKGAAGNGTPIARPQGPVAQPILTGVTQSHVQVTVSPLGMLRYDAQTLPIVSPDGRHVAVQQGLAPTWDTLLATRGEEPADQSGLAIYTVTDSGLEAMTPAPPLPAALLLGRDADEDGFLVESVRADGARWIGRVSWVTGAVEWLSQGSDITAHASIVRAEGSLARAHGLVYVRRTIGTDQNELVYRDSEGHESVLHDAAGSYMFPAPSRDGSVIFACLVQPSGDGEAAGTGTVDLDAVRTVEDGQHAGARKLGAMIAQRPLGKFADPFAAAYQVFASVQPGAWCHSGSDASRGAIGFAHPGRGRAAVMQPGDGVVRWMPAGTVSVVGWNDAGQEGYFCTAPKELVYQAVGTGEAQPSPTRVLNSPYVARVVEGLEGPRMLLFGPTKQRQDLLEVVRLGVGAPPEAAASDASTQ